MKNLTIPAHPHFDAAQNINIARQLEYVIKKVYEQPYPTLKARQIVPVSNEVAAGSDTIRYDVYDHAGKAKRIRSYTDDLPSVNVKVDENRSAVWVYGVSFGYSKHELRAAALSGSRLPQRKAMAARDVFERTVDDLIAFGDNPTANVGLLGFLTIPGANTYTVPADGTGSSALWADKTPALILRDMNGIAKYSVNLTNDIEVPDTLVIPTDQYALISSTARSDQSDTTILNFFLDNSPYIKTVIPWSKLTGAGAGSTDRMVAYRRDPMKLTFEIPMEYTQYPALSKNLGYEVACEGECGGVICPFPKSVTYGDGI